MPITPARRLTVGSIAPVVDGIARTAPQPLGTWMSRWSFVYTDADVTRTAEAPGSSAAVRALPHYPAAA